MVETVKPRTPKNWSEVIPSEVVVYQQSPWELWSGVQLVHMAHRLPEFHSVSNFHAVFSYQGESGYLNVKGQGKRERLHIWRDQCSFVPSWCSFDSEPEGIVMENIGVLIDPAWLTNLIDRSELKVASSSFHPIVGKPQPRITEILKLLNDDLRQGLPFGKVFGESLVTVLGQSLLTDFAKTPAANGGQTLTRAQLSMVESYINDNLVADLRLRDIAEVLGYSEFHFHRLFKQTTGIRLHEHIVNIRLERAEALLITTRMSISEIAAEVGFSDVGHFARHLKRRRGVTPSEFRKRIS